MRAASFEIALQLSYYAGLDIKIAAARHDAPALDARDDLVFDALTRELTASAA